jgi:hypothetical protein
MIYDGLGISLTTEESVVDIPCIMIVRIGQI